jgi:CheY-like chemotaxis protein
MGKPLHILIVDDRPDGILFLSEFLLAKQHYVESSNSAHEALEAIIRKHRTTNTYDLLICDVVMPNMDGLTLVRELRRRNILLPVALYTAYGAMNPNLAHDAQQLHCLAVLDKPIELRRIENLINEVHAKRYGTARQQTHKKDEPFFGTSRVAKPATEIIKANNPPGEDLPPASGGYALEPRKPPIAAPLSGAPTAPSRIRSPQPLSAPTQEPLTRSLPSFRTPLPTDTNKSDGTDRRVNPKFRTPLPFLQPNQPPIPPLPPPLVPPLAPPLVQPATQPPTQSRAKLPPPVTVPAQQPHTTSYIRRSVQPPTKEQTGPIQRNPPTLHDAIPQTTRIRRTVTGSYSADNQGQTFSAPASSSRAVACAHCNTVFMVAVRATSYTAVCVHCGQMNRIDPL